MGVVARRGPVGVEQTRTPSWKWGVVPTKNRGSIKEPPGPHKTEDGMGVCGGRQDRAHRAQTEDLWQRPPPLFSTVLRGTTGAPLGNRTAASQAGRAPEEEEDHPRLGMLNGPLWEHGVARADLWCSAHTWGLKCAC
ncbi:hypothetical protein NDU88_002678 [Pleurodeles waltl]|uniref:Uncharacterized protein n=1 Tax=Pleurodeles waltl TaxID=8319 RepID=A0AAV7L1X9_PLEWA|nr:hypothetical protein NDU88_002678 [Pleurodeles waltl]